VKERVPFLAFRQNVWTIGVAVGFDMIVIGQTILGGLKKCRAVWLKGALEQFKR
jgi:hypothetical protein